MMELINPFIEKRLKNNGALLFKRIMERKVVSLRKLGDTRSERVRFERWIGNEKVTVADLIKTEQARLRLIVKNRHVLAIQDTTELNYQKHANRVKGLGTVGNGKDKGFFIHPMLVLDAETTACLGSAAIHIENRLKGANEHYEKLPIEEKESYRWISTAEASKKTLVEADCVTFIGDRENDIYEFIDRIPDEKTHILTRVWHDRCLEDGDKVFSHLEKKIESGQLIVQVRQDKRNNREKREALLSIKHSEVVIKRPKPCTDKAAAKTIKLTIVEAKEINCPTNQKPIHWALLTTHKVTNFDEATQIILWYRTRWNVEQIFRTMKKQGLDVESSQIESAESLMKLAVIALSAAILILQLVLARDGETNQKTSDVFGEEEKIVLGKLLIKLEGKTIKQKNPYPSENLSWASWIIARLGGWNGYKNERPGPNTMGWGLQRFQGIFDGWKLIKDVCAE